MQRLYDEPMKCCAEVLWDDRSVGADVMFSSGELFGAPPRAVASPKRLKNGAIGIASRDGSCRRSA